MLGANPITVQPPLIASNPRGLLEAVGGSSLATGGLRSLPHHGRSWSPSYSTLNASAAMSAVAGGSSSGLTRELALTMQIREGTLGTARTHYLGPKVIPQLRAVRWRDGYPVWGKEHLQVIDTLRGLSEPRKRVTHIVDIKEFSLALFGLAAEVNEILANKISDSVFDVVQTHLMQVVRAMDLSAEYYRREVLDPANFPPGNVKDLAGTPITGSGGSIKAEFNERVAVVIAAHPQLVREQFKMVISDLAWTAIESDDLLQTSRGDDSWVHITEEIVAQHIGVPVGNIVKGDAAGANELGDAESMYGDRIYIFPAMEQADLQRTDNAFGAPVPAFERVMPMDVQAPWRDEEKDTMIYPVDRGALPVVNDTSLFGILENAGG